MPQGLDPAVRAVTGPRAIALAAGLVAAVLAAPAAAQPRVAVLPFSGKGAANCEDHVLTSLPRSHFTISLPMIDQVIERSGRRLPTTPPAYVALARKLRATAIVEGRLAPPPSSFGDWRLRVTVRRGGTGLPVGTVAFRGNNRKDLENTVRQQAGHWLKVLLERITPARVPPGPRAKPPAPAPEPMAEAPEPEAPPEPAPAARPEEQQRPVRRALAMAARDAEAAEPEEAPPALARRPQSRGDDEPPGLASNARPEGESPAPLWEVSVGPRLLSRAFIFTDNVSGLPGYSLPGTMAVFGEGELFPGARSKSPIRRFGFAGQWESAIGAKTRGREGQRSYTTKTSSYRIGPRFRIRDGGFALTLGADYGEHRFELDIDEAVAPNVAYTLARPSVAARIAVTSGLSLGITAAYLHIMSVGGLGDPERFPRITALGAEAAISMGYAFDNDFELRLAADLRHYALDMHARPGDKYIVGGAVDEHFGAMLLLNYRAP